MRKILKYTSVFTLWLAGLTLSAHLLIPHDHHSSDTFANQDEKCPVSKHSSDDHSGIPLHCYSFNDLTSERTRFFQFSEKLHVSFDSFNILTDNSSLILHSSFITLKEFSKPLFDTSILKSPSLRAPPALS